MADSKVKREQHDLLRVDPQDKEKAFSLKGNQSIKAFFKELLIRYEEHPRLKAELEKWKFLEPSLKEITTKYDGHCSKCDSIIPAGNRDILYGKDDNGKTILICVDCQINAESDRTIVKRLRRRKELDRTIKALENEQNRMLSQNDELYILESIKEKYLSKDDKTFEKDEKNELKSWVKDLVELKKGKIMKSTKTARKLPLEPQKEKKDDFAKEIFKILRDEQGFMLTPSEMMKLLQEIKITGKNERGGLLLAFKQDYRKDGLTTPTILRFFEAYMKLDPQLDIYHCYH